MSSLQIIVKRLEALERENALLKSQVRELSKKPNIKPQVINNIVKSNDITAADINKMICDKITLTYVNKLYGKK
jgi:hypothetical protein